MSEVKPGAPSSARSDRAGRRHMWFMGLVGVGIGATLLLHAPSLHAVSGSVFLLAFLHIAAGVVLGGSLWVAALRRASSRRGAARPASQLEFGWGPGWMNGLGLAAVATLASAVVVQVQWPAAWPLSLLLTAQAVLFGVGDVIMQGLRRPDQAVLPRVRLCTVTAPLVLDAGCGAGRTTNALSRGLTDARLVDFDRFDADYIDGGGRALLARNLDVATLEDRVQIKSGDLSAMPFADATFDAVASTNVYDHLGKAKAPALRETSRVLKPGGRFLMAVAVPSWSLFAVGSLLSLALTRPAGWRRLADDVGFLVVDEGVLNHTWFVVLERPRS